MKYLVNINENIEATLTKYGEEIYRNHLNSVFNPPDNNKPVESEEFINDVMAKHKAGELSEFQLWEFMHIFGQYMFNGANNVIENNNIYFKWR